MGSRVPRPRAVCSSCGNTFEQTSAAKTCAGCLRNDDDRDVRQQRLGARAGVGARGDFDAVFRDARSPFARGFRSTFFRQDALFQDGMEGFVSRLRDFYADQIEAGRQRSEQRYREGFDAGYAKALSDRQSEAA